MLAALTIAISASESQCRVRVTRRVPQPMLWKRRFSGTVSSSAARKIAVSAGTTQRTTENAPACWPAMKRLGRSA